MTIVIKEMVVKTTVEAEKQPQVKALSPEETDRLKEEILREIEKNIAAEPKRKER